MSYGQSSWEDSGFQRVRLKQNLSLHVRREFHGSVELTNLSRENLSRGIGRKTLYAGTRLRTEAWQARGNQIQGLSKVRSEVLA